MLKKTVALLLSLFIIPAFSACGSTNNKIAASSTAGQVSTALSKKVKVSVTFNAMKEFTEAVGKEKVEISTIIPDGTEPHDFEPKAKDLTGLSSAQVFVYSGFGMESWADKAIEAADNKNLVAVEASKGATPIQNTDTDEIKEHGQYDPHIWISLKGAETEAKNIRDGLVKADPSSADYFKQNCDSFISQLESLYSEYNTKFHDAKNRSFVTGHAAFAYLCRDFGLKQNSVEDVFAEGEPSAQKLAGLVDYCKKNNVKTIFVEDMVSPAVSQTLANQIGAKVEQIYTIESGEDHKTYLERMKSNLNEIYDSLSR
ncbi:High-affinity zinc uptake system binding-protein ZnuA [Caprobacter fermentans]|uniref:High-affinity zinc uptake system binding-protein ZnuA n=1 Tax=Caproicibacter fermentans TaxID=2576756 RepID=A0A6N8HUL7_9FIRM|nr:metal ABC transporter substrate-binding protein [Caproicibacter fermentans]MVB09392.1 High-affinity zinc uptake system binding-protein ZnuA [Caproicibacter fermentans]